MASDQARDLARLANEQAFDLVGIDGGVRLYKLQQTIEKLAALATPPAAATSAVETCLECGAMSEQEAETKCLGQAATAGDDCHGCTLWDDTPATSTPCASGERDLDADQWPEEPGVRYCLCCQKEGHRTSDCWSTHAMNSPEALEISRLCAAANQRDKPDMFAALAATQAPAVPAAIHPQSLPGLVDAAGGTVLTGGGAAFTSVALARFVVLAVEANATAPAVPATDGRIGCQARYRMLGTEQWSSWGHVIAKTGYAMELRAVGESGKPLATTVPAEAPRLQAVSDIAHYGGLAGLGSEGAMDAIRGLTLPWFRRSATLQEAGAFVRAALTQAASTGGKS